MKKIIASVIILFVAKICLGQNIPLDSTIINSIHQQANTMAGLLIKKDYEGFSKYTYPKLVEMLGGREKMIETLQKSIGDLEKQGFAFLNFKIGNSSNYISYKGELQCLVEQILEMKVPEGKMTINSTLIAISKDKGENWYFVDTQNRAIEKLREILDNLSPEIVIPEKKEPVMTND